MIHHTTATIQTMLAVVNRTAGWILKQIGKRNGGPTDTSRDHEMTDWQQVQHFVERFAAAVDQASRSEVATGERA